MDPVLLCTNLVGGTAWSRTPPQCVGPHKCRRSTLPPPSPTGSTSETTIGSSDSSPAEHSVRLVLGDAPPRQPRLPGFVAGRLRWPWPSAPEHGPKYMARQRLKPAHRKPLLSRGSAPSPPPTIFYDELDPTTKAQQCVTSICLWSKSTARRPHVRASTFRLWSVQKSVGFPAVPEKGPAC
jgi:hypothetical protein